MIKSLDGLSYSPETRIKGPVNVLKYINNRIVGVGDATPIKWQSRMVGTLLGGVRLPISLPTDRNIVNMPVANTQNIKDIMGAVKRDVRKRRANNIPRVILQNGYNGLDHAQTPNMMPPRNQYDPQVNRIRGAILSSYRGPVRSNNMMYRMQTMPRANVLRTQIDTPLNKSGGFAGVNPPAVLTVNVEDVKNNPKLEQIQGNEPTVNPTVFFIGALVLAFLVLRK